VLAHRPSDRAKQLVRFKLGHNVIVYLQQQLQPIPLFFSLPPVKLYAVPRQRALERNRNVRSQRTEHLDVFGGKLLSLQLWR